MLPVLRSRSPPSSPQSPPARKRNRQQFEPTGAMSRGHLNSCEVRDTDSCSDLPLGALGQGGTGRHVVALGGVSDRLRGPGGVLCRAAGTPGSMLAHAAGFLFAGAWTCSAGNGGAAEVDRRMMRRCVELARRAAGQTRPNPIVGCVVTSRDGLVVGEGFHERAGGPHAEVVALRLAGEDASGGTAYVSLEPCNHYGRTPPCVDALLRARIGRVFVGMVDPDPRTGGDGIARLRDNGVDVTVGVEEELCQSANEGFSHRILKGRPLGTWKYAMTLDGKIAADSGSSRWISGPDSRSTVQQIRSETDAIIVGGNTVRQDDPRLTVREKPPDSVQPVLQPYRVVFTRTLQLPRDARLWDSARAPTTVFTTPEAVESQRGLTAHLRGLGVDVVEIEGLSPAKAMDKLHEMGALNVLWECGGRLAAEAVRDGCIQKVVAFVAPKLIGGSTYTPLHGIGLDDMGDALALEGVRLEQIGNDVMISGYLPRGHASADPAGREERVKG